jgi:hypothetical protein
MKRALIFLVLGPVMVALMAPIATAAIGAPADAARFVALVLFFFTLPVGAVVGAIDGYLSEVMPLGARAPATAAVGGTTAIALAYTLIHWIMPAASMMPVALFYAVTMGLCSLFAHNYGSQQTASASAGPA